MSGRRNLREWDMHELEQDEEMRRQQRQDKQKREERAASEHRRRRQEETSKLIPPEPTKLLDEQYRTSYGRSTRLPVRYRRSLSA